MEPQLPKPQLPSILHPVEVSPARPIGSHEMLSPVVESTPITPIQPPTASIAAVTPQGQQITNRPASSQPVQASPVAGPAVAADDDVIEREWVDKAKQVVNNTSGDPRLQKRNVSLLQADYISKRYGKELKLPKD